MSTLTSARSYGVELVNVRHHKAVEIYNELKSVDKTRVLNDKVYLALGNADEFLAQLVNSSVTPSHVYCYDVCIPVRAKPRAVDDVPLMCSCMRLVRVHAESLQVQHRHAAQ